MQNFSYKLCTLLSKSGSLKMCLRRNYGAEAGTEEKTGSKDTDQTFPSSLYKFSFVDVESFG